MSQHASAPPVPDAPAKPSVRAAASSFLGTTVEWYDYFIYGTAAALVFPRVFFSDLSPAIATVVSLTTFAVAFILRPVGGIVFGHFGDRVSRKKMLIITLLGMGLCTGLIGLIPPETQIGVWAPILLIVCRIFQGFMLGGEWGGAALMSVERAPDDRRGFYGSWMQAGVPAGLLVSSGMFALVSTLDDEAFMSWGWRIPFLLAIVLMGIGMYVRLSVEEPQVFTKIEAADAKADRPIVEAFRHAWRKIVWLSLLQSAANVGYFLITVYSLTYVTDVLHMPRSVATTGLMIGAAVDLVMQPVFGLLSDKIGRLKVYAGGVIFLGALAFPFYLMLDSRNELLIVLAFVLGLGIGHAATGSLHGVIYAEQFSTRYRYSGSSIAYQTAGIISSGPTPLIAASLVAATGASTAVGWYVVGAAVISLVSVAFLTETYRASIDF
ncbi:MFS transporter [Saccharopolyspora spinosa]|uniref:Putative proline/betaine transporter n=1 Tax=Saccharopolyspora spinosa TaxID=60894 RepID=A0A2N3XVD3_SACSN|nr:MFS transporter [Saccharopolyspora spinosa]PKW14571.1 metabolite-proton symporter [Saccharopolyspora spinosa]